MADSKKYIGIYDTLEDVQDALDNGQLSKPYVAKTMDNGHLDYNSLSPVDYSQYWCTYYPIDAKIYVKTKNFWTYNTTEYTGGDGKIPKADFPDFYGAGSGIYNYNELASNVVKFKYFQFDSTSATTDFTYAWRNCSSLKEFPMIDTSKGTDFESTWEGCSSLTTFPMLNLSSGIKIASAWKNCSKLTEFPLLDVSQGTNFAYAWMGCSNLTEFPSLNMGKGTNFSNTWEGCSSLKEFPLIDTSKGSNFAYAWHGCRALTSFPQLDLSNGTEFQSTWNGCSSLKEFPALDLSKGVNFTNAWLDCSAMTTMPQLDLSAGTNFSWPFGGCDNLTTLGGFGAISADIDLSPCTKLTVDSLMNVITQAATVTGKTMTLGSTNLAKLSDEQKAVATSKGWTLA